MTALSAPQLLVLWSLACDHSPNPALVAAVHAAWQEAKAAQPTTTELQAYEPEEVKP